MLVRTLRAARPTQLLRCASAVPQTSPDATLKETLTAQIPQKQEELKQLKADHGSKVLGEVTVDQCIGGGRGVRCMLWETSLLDAAEGIRFRGYTIPECQELLPTFKGPAGDGEPTPEAMKARCCRSTYSVACAHHRFSSATQGFGARASM